MYNKIIKLIALVGCLWIAQHASAQFVGAKAGAGTDGNFTVGVTFEYFLNHHFSLATAASYYAAKDPLKDYYDTGYFGSDRSKSVGFLAIPLMLEYKYLLTDNWRIYLGAGPAVNLRISGTTEAVFSGWNEKDQNIYEEDYKSVMPAVTAVAGVEYRNLRIGLQFDRQFSSITSMDTDTKIQSFLITLGFRFGGNNNFRKTSVLQKAPGY